MQMLKKVDTIRPIILKPSSIEDTLSICLIINIAVLANKSSANVPNMIKKVLTFFESGRNLIALRFCSSFLYTICDFGNSSNDDESVSLVIFC